MRIHFDPRFSSVEMNRRLDSLKPITESLYSDFLSLNGRPAFKSLMLGRPPSSVLRNKPGEGNLLIQNNGHLCPSLCPEPNTLEYIDQ